ncbi:large ribosomal subunit protein mL46-like [Musca vetustissima]|uniref:large ribosomal subunit protein mL46-like n=1 Tax=Musca vetustissima TaxID=27455 RepID=UPI002AB70BD5|nr:large ribosomal subunit protein mL46-like [Musca vetustissima]
MLRRATVILTNQVRLNTLSLSRPFASAPGAAAKQEKWDLYAGVLVERLPVVSKELNALEKEFQEYLWRVEFEKSLKSDSELQHERDLKQAELLKKGQVDLDEAASKQTAQDLKDAYTEELNKFEKASRTTADDKANNILSTNRCLDDTLYLLVEQTVGSKKHFLLPQGPRLDGETMRQAAERIVREKCGDQLDLLFYGNAPCGFYKYKYPASVRDQSVGAKVFFFRASLKNGNVDKNISKNFAWMQKDALSTKLNNERYVESVQKFLF